MSIFFENLNIKEQQHVAGITTLLRRILDDSQRVVENKKNTATNKIFKNRRAGGQVNDRMICKVQNLFKYFEQNVRTKFKLHP